MYGVGVADLSAVEIQILTSSFNYQPLRRHAQEFLMNSNNSPGSNPHETAHLRVTPHNGGFIVIGIVAIVVVAALALVALRPNNINADRGSQVEFSPRNNVEARIRVR